MFFQGQTFDILTEASSSVGLARAALLRRILRPLCGTDAFQALMRVGQHFLFFFRRFRNEQYLGVMQFMAR